jgi:hypothetical protein
VSFDDIVSLFKKREPIPYTEDQAPVFLPVPEVVLPEYPVE